MEKICNICRNDAPYMTTVRSSYILTVMVNNCKLESKVKVISHFKNKPLAALQFKEVLKENKGKKYFRDSGKMTKKIEGKGKGR